MTRKILQINDTHLTDNPIEEYRWKIFDFVKKELDKGGYTDLFHLGDVFDKKDKHSSKIVNRIITSFLEISIDYCPVTIMGGNHDYTTKREECFLRFLNEFESITWIDKPTYWEKDKFLFLPHSRNPEEEWQEYLPIINDPNLKFLFMHQSIIGCKVSNYHELNCGLDPNFLKNVKAIIISGDIHVNQILRNVTYTGTQHPVSFGDSYQPRMLSIIDDTLNFIPIETIKREHIKIAVDSFSDILYELKKLKAKDQVNITLLLDKNQLHQWFEFKQQILAHCKRNNIELHDLRMEKISEDVASAEMKDFIKTTLKSLSSEDILLKYAQIEKINKDLLNIGMKIFKGT